MLVGAHRVVNPLSQDIWLRNARGAENRRGLEGAEPSLAGPKATRLRKCKLTLAQRGFEEDEHEGVFSRNRKKGGMRVEIRIAAH